GLNWQSSNVFAGLDDGVHNFLARHLDTGCVVSVSQTVLDPNTFTIDLDVTSNVVCYGDSSGALSFSLIDVAGTYITGGFDWWIYDAHGTPTDTSDDQIVATGNSVDKGPETYSGLAVGSYRLVMTQDEFPDCTQETAFTITGPSAALMATATPTDITCDPTDNGVIEITASGGWGGYGYFVAPSSNPAPATGDYVATPRFEDLVAGEYQIWVIDQMECPIQLPNVTLINPDEITATLQINNDNCEAFEGEIEVVGTTGGQGSNYSYQLILDGANLGEPQSSPVFSNLGAGTYTVQITDQWGCDTTLTTTLD